MGWVYGKQMLDVGGVGGWGGRRGLGALRRESHNSFRCLHPFGAKRDFARLRPLTGSMGKLMLGLAMAAVVLRSYIGLSPWKLALLLLSLFVLNLLQVRVRVGAVWRGHVSPCTG